MDLPTKPSVRKAPGSNYVPPVMTPQELFLKLTEAPFPTEIVPYPRDEEEGGIGEVRIKVLRDSEMGRLRIAARRWARDKYKLTEAELESKMGDQIVSDRIAKEILAQAILAVEPIDGSENIDGNPIYPRIFMKPESLDELPPREIGILWGLWNLVQNRIGPNEGAFEDAAEIEVWVKMLEEGGRPFGFFLQDLPQQELLVGKLVSAASHLFQLLRSPSEDLQSTLESIKEQWDFGTSSSTEPVADSTSSQNHRGLPDLSEKPLDAETAMRLAKKERSRILKQARDLNEDLKD